MKTIMTIEEIINDKKNQCPLPLDVITDRMGINLVSVDSIEWKEQEDGQLVSLVIKMKPENGK